MAIPKPVIRRFPKYLSLLQELRRDGQEWVSSQGIAEALGLTSSTVRQDLSHIDLTGISKRGYETAQLEAVLRSILGADLVHRVVIIGAGHLGSALGLHGGMERRGFEICGVFDADNKIVGKKVGELQVQSMGELKAAVRRTKADMGIIAVPSVAAQEVADALVEAGVQAILNLAYAHVLVPESIALADARIIESLQELAYAIQIGKSGG